MCILFIYRNPEASVDSFRLIVVSNRDEVLNRPAKPAHYWEKHPHCLGGTFFNFIHSFIIYPNFEF